MRCDVGLRRALAATCDVPIEEGGEAHLGAHDHAGIYSNMSASDWPGDCPVPPDLGEGFEQPS